MFQVGAGNPLVGSTGARPCCAGAARGARQRRRAGAISDALTASTRTVSVNAICARCSTSWDRSGSRARRSTASRSATRGAIRTRAAKARARAGSPSQAHAVARLLAARAVRGAGVALTDRDALTALPSIATAGCCSTPACRLARSARGARARGTSAAILVVEWRALTVALSTSWRRSCAGPRQARSSARASSREARGPRDASSRARLARSNGNRLSPSSQRRHRIFAMTRPARRCIFDVLEPDAANVHVLRPSLVQHKLTLLRKRRRARRASADS